MGFTLIYNTAYKESSKYLNPDLYAYTDYFFTQYCLFIMGKSGG